MSNRTYSVIAVVSGQEKRLMLVTNDALKAFDFVADQSLIRRNSNQIGVTEYLIYDGSGALLSQAVARTF